MRAARTKPQAAPTAPARSTPVPERVVVVPSFAGVSAKNAGAGGATALLVAVWAAPSTTPEGGFPRGEKSFVVERAADLGLAPGATGTITVAPGVTADALTTVGGVAVAPGARLAVGTVAMAPGTSLTLPGGPSPLILAVEAGSLAVEASRDLMWVSGAEGWPRGFVRETTLAAGDGAEVETGAASVWRVVGEQRVTALVVTIDAAR
jgi:hypothetical protein